ncbi:hypothetical protein RB195_010116 [Necator americanus]|uniref:BPTI/Kunitz inhibitor domain-containing protein n=1 Tax=Necator americanus TaxID=51031 RepID=A0ABR1CWG3_NECAM
MPALILASSSHKHQRPERQTGSGRVGDACVFNTDCLTGMFCNSGQCACLSSYIAAESYCYQKIDPGQPGCTYDEQCSSVWPDAFCDNSAGVGTCRCGENKVERATRDGHVCLDMLDANQNVLAITCPLPEGAGYTSALSDSKHPRQANNPGPVLCNTESLLTHQSGEEAGDGSAGCLFPSDGAYVADLYDCVGFVSSVDLTSSGYSDKANGICCPNRAFTCIQPTATGPNPTDPRWWYNAITACVRGAPEYESRSSFLEETPLTGCSQSTSCSNNFECKTVGSSQWCCPSVASVCGPVGGRPQDTSIHIRGSVYHVGVEKQTMIEYCKECPILQEEVALQKRSALNLCVLATVIAEPRCLQGQAYKDNTGKFVTCSTNRAATSCPVNYECHYDGNIFGCCPSKAFTCSLAPNQGKTCGPGVSFKFFYNSQSQECESFEYLGCDGNSNTFASRQECESYCGVGGCTNGGVPLRDSSGALQTCSEKSGGCPSTHECHAVSLSPGTVAHRCCPSKTYICGLPPQQGSSLCSGGSSVITRYYFNIVTKKCSPFTFNGCDGNPNNFPSLTQCNNFCLASACSAGDVVYVNPNTQTPISCNDEIRNNCPKNFQCVFDSLTDMSVCCGATDMGVCPEGEKAYISAADMSVRECLINEPNSCPTNYLCRFNASKNRYFCCGSTKRSYCPTGRAPYKDQMSAQAMRCTMSAVASTCPDGFECQSDVKDALQGYCCSVSDICPNKEEYYVDESSEMPRSCSIGHFVTCPAGFTCMTQSDGISGYCCRGKPHLTPSDGCPPGEIVYMDKNEVVVCDPFNLSNQGCPSSFTCQWSVRTQRYQCCGANPIPPSLESDGCPSRQIAFIDVATGKPQICTSASMSCPIGYFCQFSQQHKQFQCCGIPSDCPAPMVAFIGISGEHQRCSMSGGQICPEGFSCVKGKRNEDICCAGSEACESTQVSVNGRCLPIQHIGSKCEHKSQCLGDSTCTAGVCRCPTGTMEQNQRCVEAPKECAINQVEFIGECLPIVSLGRACVQSIQCRGGGYCVEGVCDCPSGTVRKLERCEKKVLPVSSTSRTTSSHPTVDGSTDVKEENAGLCPTSRLPYVINGTVKSCVGGRSCPAGYTCTFSKAGRNYFCCSNSIRSIIEGEVCKAGKPLLYPKTGQPVTCSRIRECPAGYSCKRNLATQLFHCCTTPKPLPMDHYINQIGALAKKINAQKRINFLAPPQKTSKRSPCPTNLVLFEVQVESKLIRRCQASCPSAMSVINGVCRSRLRENPLRQPNTASAEDTTT